MEVAEMFETFWMAAVAGGGIIVLVMLFLLVTMVRRAGRSALATERVAVQMNNLGQAVTILGSGSRAVARQFAHGVGCAIHGAIAGVAEHGSAAGADAATDE